MFFDGYAWRPLSDVAQHAQGAVVLARYASKSIKKDGE